jgi:hypothetical protein
LIDKKPYENLWRTIQFIPEYRGRVIGVIAVGTILGFIGTATPYLYKFIVDAIAQLLAGTISKEEATWSVTVLLSIFFALRLGVWCSAPCKTNRPTISGWIPSAPFASASSTT